jgi:HSP20 family protein
MSNSQEPNWSDHLDDLESLYNPEDFFSDQKSKPTNEVRIHEHFSHPTFTEEAEIPEEGQLSIDIFQDNLNLYIIAPVAGVKPEKIEIDLDKDILTIKGEREKTFESTEESYLYKECYWGRFSRSIILPVPVKNIAVQAEFKDSVLKITLPKAPEAQKVEIKIKAID